MSKVRWKPRREAGLAAMELQVARWTRADGGSGAGRRRGPGTQLPPYSPHNTSTTWGLVSRVLLISQHDPKSLVPMQYILFSSKPTDSCSVTITVVEQQCVSVYLLSTLRTPGPSPWCHGAARTGGSMTEWMHSFSAAFVFKVLSFLINDSGLMFYSAEQRLHPCGHLWGLITWKNRTALSQMFDLNNLLPL